MIIIIDDGKYQVATRQPGKNEGCIGPADRVALAGKNTHRLGHCSETPASLARTSFNTKHQLITAQTRSSRARIMLDALRSRISSALSC